MKLSNEIDTKNYLNINSSIPTNTSSFFSLISKTNDMFGPAM
jgi:hypothetical protein